MSDQKQLDEIPRYIMMFSHAWPDPNGRWCAWEDVSALLAERDALQAEVLRLRVAMAKAAQRADDWPNSNDDPADVLSDCADTLYGALDAEQTDRGDP